MITNEFSEKVLKGIRSFERKEELSKEEKIRLLVETKLMIESLEESFDSIKADISEKIDGVCMIPEYSKKVYMSEGKSSTSYNVKAIYDEMKKKKMCDNFFEIIAIQKGLYEKQPMEVQTIVVNNSETSKGNPYLTIGKMTKQELVEAKKG